MYINALLCFYVNKPNLTEVGCMETIFKVAQSTACFCVKSVPVLSRQKLLHGGANNKEHKTI